MHNCYNKYLVRVLVVLLHARFGVVGPIPFLLAAIFFPGHPYIGSTTILPDMIQNTVKFIQLEMSQYVRIIITIVTIILF